MPRWSLITCGVIGLIAAWSGLTAVVITISCFGTVIMYIISIGSFIVLRKSEPSLKRPFKAPAGLLLGAFSFVTLMFCLYCLVVYNLQALIPVAAIYGLAIVYYLVWGRKNIRPYNEEFGALDELV